MDDFRTFADEVVAPRAAGMDLAGRLDESVVRALAEQQWMGACITSEHGGTPLPPLQLGALCEELGRVCSATRSLLTVHSMAAVAIERWGTRDQRDRLLPTMARGSAITAFALTEPGVGSDASAVESTLRTEGADVIVSGSKRWVTAGLRADWLLVIARAEKGPTAVLVPTDARGLSLTPVELPLGLRGASLAHVEMEGVRVPADSVVGKPGAGVSHVASTALDHGRFTVAWGCVGMARGCLEASADHAGQRSQYGELLGSRQLVRSTLGMMATDVCLARHQCEEAARLRTSKSPAALIETVRAKYAAARIVERVAADAVQLHGSAGCASGHVVERHYRDAKVMQIIEGTQGLLSLTLGEHALRRSRPANASAASAQ